MRQLDSQSDPKSPPKWTSRPSFSELWLEQGDIASDTVFTMFLLHFKGLGSAIFKQFCRKKGVDHEPYKTTLLDIDFLDILSKMYKKDPQRTPK